MAATHTSAPGYSVLMSNEGRVLRAYKDVVGVWTIAYGQTNADPDILAAVCGAGFKIKAGVAVTAEQAVRMLHLSVTKKYEPTVRRVLPDTNQPTFDAAVDFHYNTGAIVKASWPKALKAGSRPQARSGLLVWNKAGGKVLAALDRRRKREWAMIESGDYGPEGKHYRATPTEMSGGAAAPAQPGLPPVHEHETPLAVLALGAEGDEVLELRAALKKAGYPNALANRKFDSELEKVVRDFQAHHPNMTVDGRVGPASKAAIIRAGNMKSELTKTAGGGGGTAGATVGTDVAVSGGESDIGVIILVVVLIATTVAVGFTAWHYRDEIRGLVNRWLGRKVP